MPCILDIQYKMKKKITQSICISPTSTKPEAALLVTEGLPLSSAPTKESMVANDAIKESAEFPPVEIGTRGTVASLIMQEIDYFSRIESNSQDRSQRNNKSQFTNVGSSHSTNPRSTIVSTVESTKKKRVSSKLLPSMCSMVDVSDGGRPNGTSVFGYRNLRSDTKKFQF
ncbi:uncharacterized protein LOC131615830 [Vicia villosa]|uniref:uncharacterized protein LOC131615830 n=1 Tax=Vicia villosa TaxID=3911 RepID=UPI00273ACC05|nr:uncharacterized protein LOC131615830 [Vicia villosa]